MVKRNFSSSKLKKTLREHKKPKLYNSRGSSQDVFGYTLTESRGVYRNKSKAMRVPTLYRGVFNPTQQTQ